MNLRETCKCCARPREVHSSQEHIYESADFYLTMCSTLSSDCDGFPNQSISSLESDLKGRLTGMSNGSGKINRYSISDDDSGCALEEYTWVPPGLRPAQVHRYFCSLPEQKVPLINSPGERWRARQLLLQLPPQDQESMYCRDLTEREKAELMLFAQQRKRESLGRGTVKLLPPHLDGIACNQCNESIYSGELTVSCGRVEGRWHSACFCCKTCGELLVDLIYFARNGEVYCGRHHAEMTKPRCTACDEIIFADECTEAEGRSWHVHHFACFECDALLGGQRYIWKDERPYCLHCFESMFADCCSACRTVIGVDETHMSHSRFKWHAREDCFACYTCRKSLLQSPFLPYKGCLFCGPRCCKIAKRALAARRRQQRNETPNSGRSQMSHSMMQTREISPVRRDEDIRKDVRKLIERNLVSHPQTTSVGTDTESENYYAPLEFTERPSYTPPSDVTLPRPRSLPDLVKVDVPPQKGALTPTSPEVPPMVSPVVARTNVPKVQFRTTIDAIEHSSDKSVNSFKQALREENIVTTAVKTRKETTFGVLTDTESSSTERRPGSMSPCHSRRHRHRRTDTDRRAARTDRSPHSDCSTCSSSDDSDNDDWDEYYNMLVNRSRKLSFVTPELNKFKKHKTPNCIVS